MSFYIYIYTVLVSFFFSKAIGSLQIFNLRRSTELRRPIEGEEEEPDECEEELLSQLLATVLVRVKFHGWLVLLESAPPCSFNLMEHKPFVSSLETLSISSDPKNIIACKCVERISDQFQHQRPCLLLVPAIPKLQLL